MQRRRKRNKKIKSFTRCLQNVEAKNVPANRVPTDVTSKIAKTFVQPTDNWNTPTQSQDEVSIADSISNNSLDPCLRMNFIKISTQNIANEINSFPCQVTADIIKIMVKLLHEAYLIAGLTNEQSF